MTYPAGLEEQRRRVRLDGLVDLDLMAAAGMAEKTGWRGDRDPVRCIGARRDAKGRDLRVVRQRRALPGFAVEDLQRASSLEPCLPTRIGAGERPIAILPDGDVARMATPGAGRIRADEIAAAGGRL